MYLLSLFSLIYSSTNIKNATHRQCQLESLSKRAKQAVIVVAFSIIYSYDKTMKPRLLFSILKFSLFIKDPLF